jgi:hypothetical protein
MDSASLKLSRAEEQINEVIALIKQPTLRLFTEVDYDNGRGVYFANIDTKLTTRSIVIFGEIYHNLRSALDNAYWEIIAPLASSDKERRKIQFPFSENAIGFNRILADKLTNRKGADFVNVLKGLRPYGGDDGNRPLYRNRSHPQAFQAAGFAGIMGSVRLARAAAMRLQA